MLEDLELTKAYFCRPPASTDEATGRNCWVFKGRYTKTTSGNQNYVVRKQTKWCDKIYAYESTCSLLMQEMLISESKTDV